MGCVSSKVELDFSEFQIENVAMNEKEESMPLLKDIVVLMTRVPEILSRLSQYKGCSDWIKVAVRTPNVENDVAAWNAVVPAVEMLRDFFNFYDEFRTCLLRLLAFVSTDDPFISLPENLYCAKLLVQMFDFVIRFDEIKMSKASIQNDFSFYRRTMNRMKRGDMSEVQQPPVNEETANKMSLFFAYPNPFTKALIDEFEKVEPRDHLMRCFALVANACREMSERHRAPGDAEQLFALFRAMVAAIVFYDYVSVNIGGVFVKRSEIDILACINVLKEHGGDASDLLNTVRYGTHSFQRGDTPKRVLDAML